MNVLFGILAHILWVYGVIIVIRIFMSWILVALPTPFMFKLTEMISAVVDPYLNLFRRWVPTLGFFDLSPIIGLVVLYFFLGLFRVMAATNHISLSFFLIWVSFSIYQIIQMILFFLGLIVLIRIIIRNIRSRYPVSPMGLLLDSYYLKWGSKIWSVFTKKSFAYNTLMLTALFSYIIIYIAVYWIFHLLVIGLSMIPI